MQLFFSAEHFLNLLPRRVFYEFRKKAGLTRQHISPKRFLK
jgi:hypothetical protein